MSVILLWIVAIIYFCVAVEYAMQGQKGMCLAFVAYALANIGFAWDGLR